MEYYRTKSWKIRSICYCIARNYVINAIKTLFLQETLL